MPLKIFRVNSGDAKVFSNDIETKKKQHNNSRGYFYRKGVKT